MLRITINAMLTYSVNGRVETTLLQTLALTHRTWNMIDIMKKEMITQIWSPSEARTRIFPASCLLPIGLLVKATPSPFRVSTIAIRLPNIANTLSAGRGESHGT